MPGRSSDVGVRQLNVPAVACWFELSLLGGLLGALLCALLCSTLFRCFLSTFFSCHSFYVLLLFKFGVCVVTTRYCVWLSLVG